MINSWAPLAGFDSHVCLLVDDSRYRSRPAFSDDPGCSGVLS